MGQIEEKELLCFKFWRQTYAVEFSDVVEICFDMKFYHIPCLPEHFVGVCHFKGGIVPVIGMAGGTKRNIVLIVRHASYLFGILLDQKPFIVTVGEAEKAEDRTGRERFSRWREKEAYNKDGELIFLIDVERTARELVVYK